jgi:hypothetical protein
VQLGNFHSLIVSKEMLQQDQDQSLAKASSYKCDACGYNGHKKSPKKGLFEFLAERVTVNSVFISVCDCWLINR